MIDRLKVFAIGLLYLVLSPFLVAHSEELHLAVASNFSAPMKELVQRFEANYLEENHLEESDLEESLKVKLRISYGSSGKFFAQIKHGAPFDIFFSADQAKILALIDAGLAEPESRFTYAQGTLVLWSASGLTETQLQQRLRNLDFNYLALANPRLAPYGLAAEQVLENMGLLTASRSRWVLGENISQAYQFVISAHADMGLLAMSQLKGENPEEYWLIPADLYSPIYQDAVILKKAAHSTLAKRFYAFMRSDAAKSIIQAYGYHTP